MAVFTVAEHIEIAMFAGDTELRDATEIESQKLLKLKDWNEKYFLFLDSIHIEVRVSETHHEKFEIIVDICFGVFVIDVFHV